MFSTVVHKTFLLRHGSHEQWAIVRQTMRKHWTKAVSNGDKRAKTKGEVSSFCPKRQCRFCQEGEQLVSGTFSLFEDYFSRETFETVTRAIYWK